jgi:lysophospholipase
VDRRRHPPGLTFADWHAADGWALRRYDWAPDTAVAQRGVLLFLGGRGDFAEKYLEAMAHWRARGWHVAGIDWRGQGGSGRLLADPLVNHLPALDPLLDDLAAFAAALAPRVAVAHSMGAHLLLRWLAERGGTLDAAVLSSPMLGLRAGPLGTAPLALAARAACALGHAERRIWEGDAGNVGGRMTSCPDRQADKVWWKANVPAIASGAPSWGWIRAACASIAALDRAPLGNVATPLLLMVSRRDPVVSPAAIARLSRRLPAATLHLLPGRSHELLREGDAIRHAVLARIDAHLER